MTAATTRLVLARDLLGLDGDRRHLARLERAGELERIARGAYVPTSDWAPLDSRQQYILRISAVVRTRRSRVVVSHWSAAAIHGLPSLATWPREVHIVGPRGTGAKNQAGIVKHALDLVDEDVVEIDGMLVTSVARTVVDLAVTESFMAAVAVADRALHVDRFGAHPQLASRDELRQAWERARPMRAHRRSLRAVEFAEERADSVLESVSRVTMLIIGCPKPQLQQPQFDSMGRIGDTDFGWLEYNAVGEADGDEKYLNPAMRRGRSAERVVIDEKERENRIRAIPRSIARWRWAVGVSPAALRARLEPLGLPLGRRAWR
jgi:hypothetical protein